MKIELIAPLADIKSALLLVSKKIKIYLRVVVKVKKPKKIEDTRYPRRN